MLTKLTAAQIRDGQGRIAFGRLTKTQREALVRRRRFGSTSRRGRVQLRTPERRRGTDRRRVFHRAIEGSQFSIVNDPGFQPTLGPDSNTFRMVDLLLFAFEGKKSLLAPLG